jgi:transcription elongation GreA/GreB family factor
MDKHKLKQLCLDKLKQQQTDLQSLINEVQAASNNETKSTAGDKHDTARAQAQIEVERLSKQLGLINQMLADANKLSSELTNMVQPGCFIETTSGNFYISVALGRLEFDGVSFFAVSMNSPLYKHIKGKRVGDSFTMVNGQQGKVISVL